MFASPDTAQAESSEALSKLPALLAEQYPNIRAIVLARGDCVEFEYYKEGFGVESRLPVHSITKSVLSILVGIAIDKGYLRLDQKLSELLPEVLERNIDARDISVRDLLTMTSGFDPARTSTFKATVPTSEMWQWMLYRAMLYRPGIQFKYDDTGADLLSVVLTKMIKQNAERFARENLFDPLKIGNYRWVTDSEGYLIGSTDLSLTARDMAKIGILYLRHGRWGDRQIVSDGFVADSTARHNDGGPPTGAAYGYLWWVRPTKTGLDAFFAAGSGSQLIYVVPNLDLVVAMASESSIGSVRFVNEVVLAAASALQSSSNCIVRLGQGRPE